jgi:hypothetical protein
MLGSIIDVFDYFIELVIVGLIFHDALDFLD